MPQRLTTTSTDSWRKDKIRQGRGSCLPSGHPGNLLIAPGPGPSEARLGAQEDHHSRPELRQPEAAWLSPATVFTRAPLCRPWREGGSTNRRPPTLPAAEGHAEPAARGCPGGPHSWTQNGRFTEWPCVAGCAPSHRTPGMCHPLPVTSQPAQPCTDEQHLRDSTVGSSVEARQGSRTGSFLGLCFALMESEVRRGQAAASGRGTLCTQTCACRGRGVFSLHSKCGGPNAKPPKPHWALSRAAAQSITDSHQDAQKQDLWKKHASEHLSGGSRLLSC